MPTIPTYEAHEELDPDTRGLPKASVSEASAQAAVQGGKALQSFGTEISQVADRAAQQQQESAAFDTGLQNRALSQDLEGAYQKGVNDIPANGTGFTSSFMDQANQLAKQRFDQMPAGRARDQAIETWQTVGQQSWANRAFETEYKQKGIYSSQNIDQMQNTDLATVPAASLPTCAIALPEAHDDGQCQPVR